MCIISPTYWIWKGGSEPQAGLSLPIAHLILARACTRTPRTAKNSCNLRRTGKSKCFVEFSEVLGPLDPSDTSLKEINFVANKQSQVGWKNKSKLHSACQCPACACRYAAVSDDHAVRRSTHGLRPISCAKGKQEENNQNFAANASRRTCFTV